MIGVYHSGLHYGEEPIVFGNDKSGMVNLKGCHLKCSFCYTPEASRDRKKGTLSQTDFLKKLVSLVIGGAQNINLISPTHLWGVLKEPLSQFKSSYPNVPIVLKTSGYQSLDILDSMMEVCRLFVPDFKLFSPQACRSVGLPPNYGALTLKGIRHLSSQLAPAYSNEGHLIQGLVVRHLMMPGLDHESEQIVRALGNFRFQGYLNVMTNFVDPITGKLVRPAPKRTQHLLTLAKDLSIKTLFNGNFGEGRREAHYA